jgi:hypothetical protein
VHDPEKWEPVSRLREAQARSFNWLDASAGEGRSEKDHAQTEKESRMMIQRKIIPL